MATTTARSPKRTTWATPPKAPSFILGLGLGGFVDGIVLHQVLQWHHMLTATGDHPMTTVAGLESNTLADGFLQIAEYEELGVTVASVGLGRHLGDRRDVDAFVRSVARAFH